jgi:hypothetical protein
MGKTKENEAKTLKSMTDFLATQAKEIKAAGGGKRAPRSADSLRKNAATRLIRAMGDRGWAESKPGEYALNGHTVNFNTEGANHVLVDGDIVLEFGTKPISLLDRYMKMAEAVTAESTSA